MFSTKQSKAIGQIEEIINENDFENISIIGLCKKASVSLRTLEYAVQQKFDMTPIQYIRTVRLNKVRKNLQNKRLNGNLITDIANKFGFWHMGQFAKDYKNLFGELPSETLIVG